MNPGARRTWTLVAALLAAGAGAAFQSVRGVTESAAGTSLRESFRLLELPELWVLVLVLFPALLLVSWLGYRGEPLSGGARALLSILRFVALATLLVVLFRPVLVLRREEVQKAEVVVLVDDSASMRRKDAYAGDDHTRRALQSLSEHPLGETSRSELARAALQKDVLPLLAERGYVARPFAFSTELAPLSAEPGAPLELSGRGAATHVGDALAEALAAQRGRHVTDIVVLSDGRQNGGSSASEAARSAAAAGIPVHTIVIGDTRPERNAVLELVEAPSSALEGDEVAITVRVSARGVAAESGGTPRGQVELEEYDPGAGGGADARRVVAEDEVALSEGGERVTLIARPGPPDEKSGDRRFRVSIPPLAGETLLDDNALEVSVHVTPEKVRVLYVDGYPRWEYRRLALDMLKRSDENIEFQAFLLSATPDFVQESTRGTPALAAVPTERRELLEHYDVVILGDVNPWEISPDPAKCEEFLRSLVEFVEQGGGLLLIAGEYDNPRAFESTPLEPLFPISLDSGERPAGEVDTTHEFKPRLEDPANPHEIVRLAPDVELNRKLWEDQNGLRGFYWYFPVTRAKPGAQVLLRHPSEGNEHGLYPLLVTGYYPAGRTLFLAFDETWRWRFEFGHRYHERFWRNAIRWLALGRMKSGDRRYRLEVARNTYALGERVPIEARVLDEDFRPSEQSTQDVRWSEPPAGSGAPERPSELKLAAVPGKPGVFRGSVETERAGLHRVWIEVGGTRIASSEFEVVLPSQENQDPSPDPALLREVALLSHGQALDLARLGDLAAQFPGGEERREPISSRLDDVWDSWTTLLFALAVLSVEWILRKRLELV